MDDAFGDAFAVEALHLLDEGDVLHQHRAAGPGGEGVLIVGDGSAVGGGEEGVAVVRAVVGVVGGHGGSRAMVWRGTQGHPDPAH